MTAHTVFAIRALAEVELIPICFPVLRRRLMPGGSMQKVGLPQISNPCERCEGDRMARYGSMDIRTLKHFTSDIDSEPGEADGARSELGSAGDWGLGSELGGTWRA